ncbi:MAG: pseudouridine synthase, partial [Candidatus Saccharimonas sp.]
MTDGLRLNKHIALQLGISRREADELIQARKVTVDDKIATLGARFLAESTVVVAGKVLAAKSVTYRYLALNKPVGYVCSRRAQGNDETIYAIIPHEYHHLKPVGRLDRDSSGIILLTNDGDFAFRMTHPKFAKTKVYHVQLDHDLEPLHQQMISD